MDKNKIWNILLSSFWFMMIVAWLWPASWWLSVNEIHVFDAEAGQPIYMSVDREIHRPFVAEWAVNVRKIYDNRSTIICVGTGRSDYREDAVYPEDLSLDWWTDGKCKTLNSGKYILTTTWIITGAFSSKNITVKSNVFEVNKS